MKNRFVLFGRRMNPRLIRVMSRECFRTLPRGRLRGHKSRLPVLLTIVSLGFHLLLSRVVFTRRCRLMIPRTQLKPNWGRRSQSQFWQLPCFLADLARFPRNSRCRKSIPVQKFKPLTGHCFPGVMSGGRVRRRPIRRLTLRSPCLRVGKPAHWQWCLISGTIWKKRRGLWL